ncbi:acyl carrier protein [Kibdelosporangium persicum]|uniref:Oxytetracycline polyketide synthase acyl carrier n=1 Tax=Kibdelosporangium persicum TaxID=2698649 RepID=A0ABX2F792_9PSEU|nr:acyl carrier protein [Kibdelosporangium persicum]NRN67224.1 Oxytetracycline polyketide synthase acyl carrier [Kibdelosporangium persicum]
MPEKFTIEDLKSILRECAGEDEGVDLDSHILDTEFEELGYESLAIFETTSRIEREYGISLGDDALNEASTPRALLDIVNARLLSVA